MTTKVWSFEEQRKVGRKGEKLLLEHWPHPVRPGVFKGTDFIDSEGEHLELKTDTYDPTASPNFFIERWSDHKAKKPGGVWQAIGKGSTVFIYLFLKTKEAYIFRDLPALVKRLDILTEDLYSINVRNAGWTTSGFKVLRSSVADLYTKEIWK